MDPQLQDGKNENNRATEQIKVAEYVNNDERLVQLLY